MFTISFVLFSTAKNIRYSALLISLFFIGMNWLSISCSIIIDSSIISLKFESSFDFE